MSNQRWERPSEEEVSRGVIAVLYETKQLWNGKQNVDYTERVEYSALRLERRIGYGGSLPKWVSVLPAYQADYLEKKRLLEGAGYEKESSQTK